MKSKVSNVSEYFSTISKFETDDIVLELLESGVNASRKEDLAFRYSYFCLSVREALEYQLQKLAPKSDVQMCKWYLDDLDEYRRNGEEIKDWTTRRQRVIYSLQGDIPDSFFQAFTITDIYVSRENVISIFKALNASAHARTPEKLDQSEIDSNVENIIGRYASFVRSHSEYKTIIEDILKKDAERSLMLFFRSIESERPTTMKIDIGTPNITVRPNRTDMMIFGVYETVTSLNQFRPFNTHFKANIAWNVYGDHNYDLCGNMSVDILDKDGHEVVESHTKNFGIVKF